MYRTDTADSATVMPTPAAPGPNPNGYYQDTAPGGGTTADPDAFNAIQEEIGRFVEASGTALVKSNFDQLQKAIGAQVVMGFVFELATSTTDADPGPGMLRLNNATPASVTEIYIDDADENGVDASATLQSMVVGEKLILQNRADYGNQFAFDVVSVSNETGYTKVVVTVDTIIGTIATGSKLSVVYQRSNATNNSGRLLSTRIVQGSVDSVSDTTPGYIDSTDVVESGGGVNAALFDSDSATPGSSTAWSDVLPIAIDAAVGITQITGLQFATLAGGGGQDEDLMSIDITIDWSNAKIFGIGSVIVGTGYALQIHYGFAGTIAAGVNDYTANLYNGTYASGGSAPTFRINGTNKTIDYLPMLGGYRNVRFKIDNYS